MHSDVIAVALAWSLVCASCASPARSGTALISRKAFFAEPDKIQIQLSPDGRWISYRTVSGDVSTLWIAPVHEASRVHPAGAERRVLDYRWTYRPGQLLFAAPVGEGVHVFLLDATSGQARDVTPERGLVAQLEQLSVGHPDEVLIRVKLPDGDSFDYDRLQLESGKRQLVLARPVIVAQGGNDEIVPQAQADTFVAAMEKHGKPVIYVLYPDEPHDLRRPDTWISLFAIAERFFHDHLGGMYEPLGDDIRGGIDVRVGAARVPGLSRR